MGPASAAAASGFLALAAQQQQQVQWVRPPRGTLRHGLVWVSQPRVVVALAVGVVVVTVGLWLYRRLRRR